MELSDIKKSFHVKLVLIYLIFGITWILVTDRLLSVLTTDESLVARIQSFKGILFVVLSALVIYFTSKFLKIRVEKQKARNRELAYLLDNAGDAIIVKSRGGSILYWNNGAAKIYGWARTRVIGRNLEEILGYDSGEINEVIDGINSSGEWIGEMKNYTKDDDLINVYTRWTKIDEFQGEKDPVLIISTDITETKNLEEKLARVERLEALGLLAGSIAHDLNNVIQPILMSTEVLSDNLADEEQRKLMQLIRQSATRGSELVDQILSFTKGLKAKKSYVDTRSIIDEVINVAKSSFPKGISIEHSIDDDIDNIYGSKTQVYQVLMNILVNSRDAVKERGEITLRAEHYIPDDRFKFENNIEGVSSLVKITIADNGPGIRPEIREKIFEPFFTTKSKESGTGIGLSTCKRIVREHNGVIELESELGRGTEIRLYFPSSADDFYDEVSELSHERYTGRGEYVLIVENELFFRELLKSVLETANYRVITADNAQNALSILRRKPEMKELLSVVITDLENPDQNDTYLINSLKNINPGIRVIMVSRTEANDNFNELKELDNADIDGYLLKPFSNEKLLESLRQVTTLQN